MNEIVITKWIDGKSITETYFVTEQTLNKIENFFKEMNEKKALIEEGFRNKYSYLKQNKI